MNDKQLTAIDMAIRLIEFKIKKLQKAKQVLAKKRDQMKEEKDETTGS